MKHEDFVNFMRYISLYSLYVSMFQCFNVSLKQNACLVLFAGFLCNICTEDRFSHNKAHMIKATDGYCVDNKDELAHPQAV